VALTAECETRLNVAFLLLCSPVSDNDKLLAHFQILKLPPSLKTQQTIKDYISSQKQRQTATFLYSTSTEAKIFTEKYVI